MTDIPEQIKSIKRKLYACETIEQVNAIAKGCGDFVADLSDDPVFYVHGLHIKNLAQYMRLRLREGWGPLNSGDNS